MAEDAAQGSGSMATATLSVGTAAAPSMGHSPSQTAVAPPAPREPWQPPAPPSGPKPRIADLAISSHVGPEINLPPAYISKTIDEQITDAKYRLDTRSDEAQDLSVPYKVKPYTQAMLDGLHANAAREKDRILGVIGDRRYQELKQFSESLDREGAEPALVGPDWLSRWQENFRTNFKKLEVLIRDAPSSHAMHRQLVGTYQWYRAGVDAMNEAAVSTGGGSRKRPAASAYGAGGPHFFELGPEELAADGLLPGSAFFCAPREGDELESGGSHQQSSHMHGHSASGRDDIPPQPPAAQLPSARERLRQIKTKQVAEPVDCRPPSIQGFRDAMVSPGWGSASDVPSRSAAPSPDCLDRPFTPSTMYAGSTTARTASSARSTPSPMPLASRPNSAASGYRRPLTASSARGPEVIAQRSLLSGGLPPRPGTSLGLTTGGAIPEHKGIGWGATAAAATSRSASTAYPVEPWKIEKEPMTEAELRMEERWLQYRQKDIAEALMAEERRAMLREWSERRARVEEEIARSAETARYQSELRRRGYVLPEDAHVDIEASRTSAPSAPPRSARGPREHGAGREADSPTAAGGRLASGSGAAAVRRQRAAEVPRFDVTKAGAKQGAVRFSWDGGSGAKPKPPAVSARAAYLRRVHKRLLDPPPEAFQTTSAASNAAALRAAALAADARDSERAAADAAAGAGGAGGDGGDEDEEADEASERDSAGEAAAEEAPGSEEGDKTPLAEEEVQQELPDDDGEGDFGNVFTTAEGTGYLSLSPYTFDREEDELMGVDRLPLRRPDDSDVLATVCKHWWKHHGLTEEDLRPAGLETGLEELRFRQLQEAETIKRVFARRNRPVDAGTLERALVMPVHRITGAGANMSAAACSLPSNPFFKPLTKAKKKKKGGGGGGKKKKGK